MNVRVIGMMSGSSLDGLDIADCTFYTRGNSFHYNINSAETINYPQYLKDALLVSANLSPDELSKLNMRYSRWISEQIKQYSLSLETVELLGLHGHTVFHEPEKGYSTQLGDGKLIFQNLNIPIVTDFRNADIKEGGQGAPLSPKGDLDLFPEFHGFLNLGGISNFSYRNSEESIIGYDICPFNLAHNELASKVGLDFDKDGKMASTGRIIENLLEELNAIPFYKFKRPKSIDRVWYETKFRPVFLSFIKSSKLEDIIHTVALHQSIQICEILNHYLQEEKQILVSGGGVHNVFFMDMLKSKVNAKIIIPEAEIADYKEALIFAYLALLRALGKTNCISKVTGAKQDSIGGMLFGNWNINTN